MFNHSLYTSIAHIVIILPAFIVALSCHEFAHALVATLCGDSTPRRQGRLTLNPIAHIDFLGLLSLLLLRIGWARPVEFDRNNFRYPKTFSMLTALAGPCSNFLVAIIALVLIKFFPTTLFHQALTISVEQVLIAIFQVNIMLGVFNMLPIPPLDGSHLITIMFEDHFPELIHFLYRYSLIILLIFMTLQPTRKILFTSVAYAEHFITRLVFT